MVNHAKCAQERKRRKCAAPDCNVWFKGHPNRKYHSAACRQRSFQYWFKECHGGQDYRAFRATLGKRRLAKSRLGGKSKRR